MISAGDFRNGLTLEIEGAVFQVVEFQHVKPGKGAAFVRTKLKNIINGGVVERTFRPTEKYPQAHIEKSEMQYLYADGDMYNFMNTENYEQIALTADQIGDALKFVKENDMVNMLSYQGKVFSVEPPMFAELVITETEPGFKGALHLERCHLHRGRHPNCYPVNCQWLRLYGDNDLDGEPALLWHRRAGGLRQPYLD